MIIIIIILLSFEKKKKRVQPFLTFEILVRMKSKITRKRLSWASKDLDETYNEITKFM